jgi:hypothetical protein
MGKLRGMLALAVGTVYLNNRTGDNSRTQQIVMYFGSNFTLSIIY